MNLTAEERKKLAELLHEQERRRVENKLAYYKPYKFQKKFHNAGKDHSHRLLMAANRIGKAVRITEPVLTPEGWVEIGKLQIGDEVLTPDGKTAKVCGIYDQGLRPLYRIHFNDGTWVDCDAHHLWKCMSPDNRFRKTFSKNGRTWNNPNYRKWELKTTQQIIDHVGLVSSSPSRQYCIPVVESINYPEKNLPLDGYTLGVLLGDGGMSAASVTLSSADPEIISLLNLPEGCEISKHKSKHTYGIKGIVPILKYIGCMPSNVHTKHVPEIYKHSNQRLAVLQGLMDTDGYTNGSHCEFVSVSKQLAQDVADICRSYGIRCSIREKSTCCTYKNEKVFGTAWRVIIWTTNIPLFRLSRKRGIQYCGEKKNGVENIITKIEPIEDDYARCIEIDSPEKLYIISNYVVTHNSFSGAMEVAIHATGRYPKWWKGLKYDHPVTIIVGGQTTERTRDVCQKELMGDPTDPEKIGHGTIPKACIVDTVRRAGIPNALSSVLVKHVTGTNSKIVFNSYESGKKAWMGDNAHFVWLDEEPPEEIYTQALRAIVDLQGKLMLTFTPENGVTKIVQQYMQDLKPHQFLLNATWDDAPHITDKVKEEMLAALPPHERDMRMKGIPMVGSGLVYPVEESSITVDDFEIPDHWRRISGIDFGFDHATAWVHCAYNAETDVIYVVEAVKVNRTVISEVASILKKKGADKIPVAWPHDGLKHDSYTGRTVRDMYLEEGLNMLPEKFTNPPSPGMPEGSGGIGIEAGVAHILDRMATGRFKVFKSQQEWFEEFRLYHRKNGKIVDRNDDLMAATRYATMSLRFAQVIGMKHKVYIPKDTDFADAVVCY